MHLIKCNLINQESNCTWLLSFVVAIGVYCRFHRYFTKMPSEHYMVEGHMLLGVAAEDIPHADEIRTILKV